MKLATLVVTIFFAASISADEIYVAQPLFPTEKNHKELKFEAPHVEESLLEKKLSNKHGIPTDAVTLSLAADGKIKVTKKVTQKD